MLMSKAVYYSLCQKKRTFNPEFFCAPPGGGGPKMHMVDYVAVETSIDVGNILWIFYDCLYR